MMPVGGSRDDEPETDDIHLEPQPDLWQWLRYPSDKQATSRAYITTVTSMQAHCLETLKAAAALLLDR